MSKLGRYNRHQMLALYKHSIITTLKTTTAKVDLFQLTLAENARDLPGKITISCRVAFVDQRASMTGRADFAGSAVACRTGAADITCPRKRLTGGIRRATGAVVLDRRVQHLPEFGDGLFYAARRHDVLWEISIEAQIQMVQIKKFNII